jgi:hypothetical protein
MSIMINPVNSDKTVNTSTDKPSESQSRVKTDSLAPASSSSPSSPSLASSQSTLNVENARQLFEMENARSGSATSLTTPEQARSTLNSILQKFTQEPESTAKVQLSRIAPSLANLLKHMPV